MLPTYTPYSFGGHSFEVVTKVRGELWVETTDGGLKVTHFSHEATGVWWGGGTGPSKSPHVMLAITGMNRERGDYHPIYTYLRQPTEKLGLYVLALLNITYHIRNVYCAK